MPPKKRNNSVKFAAPKRRSVSRRKRSSSMHSKKSIKGTEWKHRPKGNAVNRKRKREPRRNFPKGKDNFIVREGYNETSKYLDCMLMPSQHAARIPYLVGVPSSLCRISSIFTFTNANRHNGNQPGEHDVFIFSFAPNALQVRTETGVVREEVFCWNTAQDASQQVTNPQSTPPTSTLFAQFKVENVNYARIVGSSVSISREDATRQLSGTGLICRSYGVKDAPHGDSVQRKRNINPVLIRQAYFKSEVSMKDENGELYMNSAPMDYSDQDMIEMKGFPIGEDSASQPRSPLIDGYVTGLSGINAIVKLRMDIVVEYIPTVDIRAMVNTEIVNINSREVEEAYNVNNSEGTKESISQGGPSLLEKIIDKAEGIAGSEILKTGFELVQEAGMASTEIKACLVKSQAKGRQVHDYGCGLNTTGIPSGAPNYQKKLKMAHVMAKSKVPEVQVSLKSASPARLKTDTIIPDSEDEEYCEHELPNLTPNTEGSMLLLDTKQRNIGVFSKKRT